MAYQDLYNNYGAVNSMFSPEEDTSIDMQANVKPVTQTIKTDPITGEQKMTITGRPEDLSADNPLTPTVTMPTGGISTSPRPQGLQMPSAPVQPGMGGQGLQMPQREMPEVTMPAFNAPAQAAPAAAPAVPAAAPVAQMPSSQAGGFLGATEDLAPPPGPAVPPAESIVAPPDSFRPPAPATAPVAPAPVATASPEYNQRVLAAIREREGNYDSPAHPLSSARGAYGITSRAYSDIQQADPYFANKNQATLTPADQDRAALVIRGLNQQRLRAEGVEPTEENQQLAHFLGPRGAADYLRTGYISDAAAAANGGLEKARQIAEERLALGRQLSGQTGPAVAGVGREMGMGEPGYGGTDADQINDLAAKGDREGLAQMYSKMGLTGRAAGLILNQQMTNDQKEAAAKNKLQAAMETGDQRGLFKMLQGAAKKTEEGNWLTYLITGLLGMEGPNKREADKLGLNDKMVPVTLGDGTTAMLQVRNGRPVAGITEDGLMNEKQLLAAGKYITKGKVTTAAEFLQDTKGNIYRSQVDEAGNTTLRNIANNSLYAGDPTKLTRMRDVAASRLQMEKYQQTLNTKGYGAALDLLKQDYKEGTIGQEDFNTGLNLISALRPGGAGTGGAGTTGTGGTGAVKPPAPGTGGTGGTGTTGTGTAAPKAEPAAETPVPKITTDDYKPTGKVQNTSWGAIDETGVAVGRPRRPGEGKTEYAKAVTDVVADYNKKWAAENMKRREALDQSADIIQLSADKAIEMLNSPGFDKAVGNPDWVNSALSALPWSAGERQNFLATQRQFNGLNMRQAYKDLRGTGAVTEYEGKKAQASISVLESTNITPAMFKKAVTEFIEVQEAVLNRQRLLAGLEPVKLKRPESESNSYTNSAGQTVIKLK